MSTIVSLYENGSAGGWLGEKVLKKYFDIVGDNVQNLKTFGWKGDIQGKRFMSYEYVRKAIGRDIDNWAQETGDCTSHAAKNIFVRMACIDKVLRPEEGDVYKEVFPPYIYGCSRVLIGGGRLWGAGSLGVWTAEAVNKFGVIATDEAGARYSGRLADQWGRSGAPRNLVELGKNNLVRKIAKVTDWESAAEAIINGYLVNVCSNWGYNMQASSDGFHAPRGTWNHSMCVDSFDWNDGKAYFLITNSWGNVHGILKDFQTGENLPPGVLRVRAEYIDKMLKQDDSYIYSDADSFEERQPELDKALFKIVGD
jgi:hypothetical protein